MPTSLTARLEDLARRHPDLRGWTRVLGVVLPELAPGRWDAALESAVLPDAAEPPLLEGLVLPVDSRRLLRLLRRLTQAALEGRFQPEPELTDAPATAAEARKMVERAVRQDSSRPRSAGGEPGPSETLAHLGSLPLLAACGRRLGAAAPADWGQGWCPTCGAWPLLAELRGLERARRLRCGRCAADWAFPWLRCPFCGEGRHRHLSALVTPASSESRRMEACEACRGSVKSLATLGPLSLPELLLADCETLELDLAGLARGFRRPALPARRLATRLVERQ